ncbi:MAG TPA: response regulator [Polyangiaceae bacterium]|jgi:two-component system response regulator AtoC
MYPAVVSSPQIKSSAKAARIIVAEDDFEMRRLVADCLRKEGYEVHEVADGAELLLRVEDSFFLRQEPIRVDLFVTDIRMPVYSGLEIVSGMREAGLDMPVVIMTAFGTPETREYAESLGAALLDKPFKMEELRLLVRRLLKRGSDRPAPVSAPIPS